MSARPLGRYDRCAHTVRAQSGRSYEAAVEADVRATREVRVGATGPRGQHRARTVWAARLQPGPAPRTGAIEGFEGPRAWGVRSQPPVRQDAAGNVAPPIHTVRAQSARGIALGPVRRPGECGSARADARSMPLRARPIHPRDAAGAAGRKERTSSHTAAHPHWIPMRDRPARTGRANGGSPVPRSRAPGDPVRAVRGRFRAASRARGRRPRVVRAGPVDSVSGVRSPRVASPPSGIYPLGPKSGRREPARCVRGTRLAADSPGPSVPHATTGTARPPP